MVFEKDRYSILIQTARLSEAKRLNHVAINILFLKAVDRLFQSMCISRLNDKTALPFSP